MDYAMSVPTLFGKKTQFSEQLKNKSHIHFPNLMSYAKSR